MFDTDHNDTGEFNNTYHINGKAQRLVKNIIDVDIHGKEFKSESHCVIVVPVDSSEFNRFMHDFKEAMDLKPDLDDVCEFPAFVGSPINMPARVATIKPNKDCGSYYIFIMSADVEYEMLQMLKSRSSDDLIQVKLLPNDQENEFGI